VRNCQFFVRQQTRRRAGIHDCGRRVGKDYGSDHCESIGFGGGGGGLLLGVWGGGVWVVGWGLCWAGGGGGFVVGGFFVVFCFVVVREIGGGKKMDKIESDV